MCAYVYLTDIKESSTLNSIRYDIWYIWFVPKDILDPRIRLVVCTVDSLDSSPPRVQAQVQRN